MLKNTPPDPLQIKVTVKDSKGKKELSFLILFPKDYILRLIRSFSVLLLEIPFIKLQPIFTNMQRLSFFLLALASSISAYAVRLPAVINSNMVLQRDMQVPIWGWGDAGEKVTVTFAGQKKVTTVGKNGEWMVKLDKLKANVSASTLTVKGKNEIKLENVLVGEVWICSGQSNMEWHVRQCRETSGRNCKG